ncbi:MAG TPA: suppressor of fused domain protein [Polyangiaceae bacterium]|nr:MAG: Suppressor of fused protein (SUFU) [Deltaproteobacteria bacterium ADurb.Bin207]HNS99997.1 suppressor of fused domain protein [Polyangiaceae bacterium]HNZ23866.1 suppressor of fused domain protein [Polyangiaceae bacterium]HOD22341.1 suppressor of fused domain protein [Polyangiaceae bacterium]HOE50242.1 suppressor of fused domain protein [Polyangiaceae bacterium]
MAGKRHAREVDRGLPPKQSAQSVAPTLATVVEIEAHVARCIGEPAFVWHELVSSLVHVDVHVVLPTENRPYFTLFTTGMSDRPMHVPDDVKHGKRLRYAELMLMLPSGWFDDPRSLEELRDERKYWPIRLLKTLARFPHACDTWLAFGHSVPNGNPPAPFVEGTKMCFALLVPPVRVPPEFYDLQLSDGRVVNIYGVVPLYPEELQLKVMRGTAALLERFDTQGVTELLDPFRDNTCGGEFDWRVVN